MTSHSYSTGFIAVCDSYWPVGVSIGIVHWKGGGGGGGQDVLFVFWWWLVGLPHATVLPHSDARAGTEAQNFLCALYV